MPTKKVQEMFALLRRAELPPDWECKLAFPWQDGVHLLAPGRRSGGIIVRDRQVTAEVRGDGMVGDRIRIVDHLLGERFQGQGWRSRIVEAAVRAAWSYPTLETDHGDYELVAYTRLRSMPGPSAWERLGEETV